MKPIIIFFSLLLMVRNLLGMQENNVQICASKSASSDDITNKKISFGHRLSLGDLKKIIRDEMTKKELKKYEKQQWKQNSVILIANYQAAKNNEERAACRKILFKNLDNYRKHIIEITKKQQSTKEKTLVHAAAEHEDADFIRNFSVRFPTINPQSFDEDGHTPLWIILQKINNSELKIASFNKKITIRERKIEKYQILSEDWKKISTEIDELYYEKQRYEDNKEYLIECKSILQGAINTYNLAQHQ